MYLGRSVVIISLSLANEGLDNPDVVDTFCSGLRRIVDAIKGIGAVPVVCSPYPNNGCGENAAYLERLTRAHQIVSGWTDCEHVDFWSSVHDGRGCWKPRESIDAGGRERAFCVH